MKATEDVLVQQNNCVSRKAHGLSATIAARWPSADPYARRRGGRSGGDALGAEWPNTAAVEDRPAMGSVLVLPTEAGSPRVACLFAQYMPGKPGQFRDPAGLAGTTADTMDSAEDRLRAFEQCLHELVRVEPELRSIAVPFRIGCGLAGGSWRAYWDVLDRFSRSVHPHITVRVYEL